MKANKRKYIVRTLNPPPECTKVIDTIYVAPLPARRQQLRGSGSSIENRYSLPLGDTTMMESNAYCDGNVNQYRMTLKQRRELAKQAWRKSVAIAHNERNHFTKQDITLP